MGRQIDVDDLVDAAAIAERLRLAGPSVVRDWVRRHRGFPAPVARFSRFAIWSWPDVEAWARATGRLE